MHLGIQQTLSHCDETSDFFSTVADNMAFSTLYLMSDVVLTYIVKKNHTCICNLGTYNFQKKLKKIER